MDKMRVEETDASGKRVWRVRYWCVGCNAEVFHADRYCRMCGGEFTGEQT